MPVFSNARGPAIGLSDSLETVCIEDPAVQDNEALQDLAVGNTFIGAKGQRFLIVTGAPACDFNCADGFDLNCDGKLGDYCAVENNRTAVAGVKNCLNEADSAENSEGTIS